MDLHYLVNTRQLIARVVTSQNLDHKKASFSTECASCHDPASFEWNTPNFKHDFFPLVDAHAIADCKKCHTTADYTSTSSACYSCHQKDFENSLNPNHPAAQLSINCNECHNTKSDWEPAQYAEHDVLHFPIYSVEHTSGAVTQCVNPFWGGGRRSVKFYFAIF